MVHSSSSHDYCLVIVEHSMLRTKWYEISFQTSVISIFSIKRASSLWSRKSSARRIEQALKITWDTLVLFFSRGYAFETGFGRLLLSSRMSGKDNLQVEIGSFGIWPCRGMWVRRGGLLRDEGSLWSNSPHDEMHHLLAPSPHRFWNSGSMEFEEASPWSWSSCDQCLRRRCQLNNSQ